MPAAPKQLRKITGSNQLNISHAQAFDLPECIY